MAVQLIAGRYLGRPERSFDAGPFRFVESVYSGGETLPMHAHEHAHFCLVLAGGYTERLGRHDDPRLPATLLWRPAGVEHAEHHLASGRHLMIEIAPGEAAAAAADPRELGWRHSLWLAQRLWVELPARDDLAVEALGFELLAEVLPGGERVERRAPRWLRAVDEELRAGYVAPPRVTELAARAGVHPVHLSRTYRRFRGSSIGDAVRALRVRAALRRLAAGREGLAQVAAAVGFADQSHFTRSFRSLTGTTPGRWCGLLHGRRRS